MSRHPRRAGALVGLVLLTTLAAVPAGAATLPRADTPSNAAKVGLLQQPAWTTLGNDVPLRLAMSGATAGLEVRAIIHSSVTSRTAFARSVSGDRLGSTVATAAAQPETLPAAPAGGRTFTLHLQDPNAARDTSRLRLPMPRGSRVGVFPVEVELRDPDSGERVSSFVTHLVAVAPSVDGAPLGEPLNVSWVWRVAADPATDPDGRVRAAFLQQIAPQGRLTRLAAAASRTGGVPLTLVPGPETIEAWAQRGKTDPIANGGVLALRAAARTQQVLTGPYVPVDLPALERAGLGNDGSGALARGALILSQALGERVDPRTTDLSPLDDTTLVRLQGARVDRLLVDPNELAPLDQAPQFTPAQPFYLQGQGRALTGFQTDDGLADLLRSGGTPALRAAHFLAGLAVVAIELPNQTRGVAVEMPPRWDPEPALLDAVLGGLGDNPLLSPVTLDTLFNRVPVEETRSGPVMRKLASPSSAPATVNPAKYRASRDRLDAFSTTLHQGNPVVALGEHNLMVSLTSIWPGAIGRQQSAARLDAVDRGIQAFSGLIETPPTGLTVTLTSREAEIPLSFNNRSNETVRVRIRFESDKLRFTHGNEQLLTLPPRNKTFRFPVETRASGTFPLRMTLLSEDGKLPLGTARYTVRSTVVSGVGVFLTIGAFVFLAIWWITHWRRSRRRPIGPATLAT